MAPKTDKVEKNVQGEKNGRALALQSALDQIKKSYGDGSIMKLGDHIQDKIAVIPTGSIALDLALGVGGLPKGRIVEIYGPESSGKTTLCQHIIAETQKMGGTAALIDAEHAFDPIYAEKTGVNVKELLVSQPDTGEQGLEIADTLIRSNAVDVIVIDSVAALVPRAEIEGEFGESTIALQARLMSQSLRRLSGAVSRSNCTLIFTNQLRMKIGVMFGNPETTPGGRALRFYASVRLEIRKIEDIKSDSQVSGIRVKATVRKNKVAPPFRTAEFDIMFAQGISKEGNLLDVGTEFGIVKKSGSWYEYKGERLGQGKESARTYLKENKKVAEDIEKAIRSYSTDKEAYLLGQEEGAATSQPEQDEEE